MKFVAGEIETIGEVAFAAAFLIPFAAAGRFHAHRHPEKFDRAAKEEGPAQSFAPNNLRRKLIVAEPLHVRGDACRDKPPTRPASSS